MDLAAIQAKPTRFVIGLMSGSSCDGVVAALMRIKGTGRELQAQLGRFEIFRYSPELRARLLEPRKDAHDICELNFELGERFAEAVRELLRSAEAQGCKPDFVASHGHTVAHIPPRAGGGTVGTLQIGETAVIAERTGLPVVSDFRQRDMAAGGQGAPLVPYADWLIFHREDRTVGCLNIGGIANITVVPPKLEDVVAFDTGPGNMAIDGAVRFLTGGKKQMDEDGALAAKGNAISDLLDELLRHPYFSRVPPKSTGREEFGPEVYLHERLAARKDQHPIEDLIATVTRAVAFSIVQAWTRFVVPHHKLARLIVSGGGAHNKTLLNALSKGFTDCIVRISDEYRIPADAREAIAFAILGNETVCATPANVPSATGARRPVVLGKITPA